MRTDELVLVEEEIINRMDLTQDLKEEEVCELIDTEILREGKRRHLELSSMTILRKNIYHAIRELGKLQELLEDPEITEIMVNGTDPVFIEKGGRLLQIPVRFETEEKLCHVIWQIAAGCNRTVNEARPIMDGRLKDGSRVNVVLPPVALNGPVLTIRRFPGKPITMEQLIRFSSISREAAELLASLVKAGYNILVSGGTGSGKTTALNALSAFIPPEERVITIEDSAELQLQGLPNLVRLETRVASVEGCQEITIRDLIRTSLRMRPTRLIVGEVRGKEAIDMLQSVNVGHCGMTTIHANSIRDVVSRLETLVLMGMEIPIPAIRRQISAGFDLMVHLGRLRDGTRRVLEIAEPLPFTEGEIQFRSLYRFREVAEREGRIIGELEKVGELMQKEKLRAAGICV